MTVGPVCYTTPWIAFNYFRVGINRAKCYKIQNGNVLSDQLNCSWNVLLICSHQELCHRLLSIPCRKVYAYDVTFPPPSFDWFLILYSQDTGHREECLNISDRFYTSECIAKVSCKQVLSFSIVFFCKQLVVLLKLSHGIPYWV